jgi:hypothetical protein
MKGNTFIFVNEWFEKCKYFIVIDQGPEVIISYV